MRKVPLEEVEVGDLLATEVRIYSDQPNTQYRIRIRKGTALSRKHLERLEREGIGYLFVRDPDLEDLDPFVHDADLEETEKQLELELQELGNKLRAKNQPPDLDVRTLKEQLKKLVDQIRRTDALIAFSSLKSHNDYTAKHSLDVTKLALRLVLDHREDLHETMRNQTGASRSYVREHMVEDLGLGTLLHDLGKWQIPNDVLNKPGELDDQEWLAIQEHPRRGRSLLQDQKDKIRAPARIPARQHHERYGGGGYPRGLEGEDIHLFGRITAVCDVYSALTSDRPYRVRKTPNRARKIMREMQEDREYFDPDILGRFLETFPPFPVGQQVVLSDGTRGVVADLTDDPDRPLVRVLYEGNQRLEEPREIRANSSDSPHIVN